MRPRTARFPATVFLALATGLVLAPATASAQDAERRIVTAPGSDYFGGDYDIVRDVTLPECENACVADSRCAAFTYNTQANWCFLKESVGERRTVAGAVSGRIVSAGPGIDTVVQQRRAELDFLPARYLDEADRIALAISRRKPRFARSSEAAAAGQNAFNAGNHPAATEAFKDAVLLEPSDYFLWRDLRSAASRLKTDDWQERQQFERDTLAIAVAAYLRARTPEQQARALAVLGDTLSNRREWKRAYRSYRASLALVENANIRERYDELIADYGFQLADHRINADAAAPQICLVFNDDLGVTGDEAGDYVTVSGEDRLAINGAGREICIDGVVHGERYRVTVRSGLPSYDGEVTARPTDLDLYIRDRSPSVRFPGIAYVLPGHEDATIPVATVNTATLSAKLYRVGDRALARVIGDGEFLSQLNEYAGDRLAETSGELVWEGEIVVESELNTEVVSAVPVRDIVGEIEPGAYVLTALAATSDRPWEPQATQWFIATELGLSTYAGDDGFHVSVRTFADATPVAGVGVRLVALNNRILGESTTGDDGRAVFDADLMKGRGGLAPALVVAESDAGVGDYAVLDLTRSNIDLGDRGVAGRPPPEPLDVFLTAERGIYRPGETAYLTTLVRDATAHAADSLPLTLIVERPDGKEARRDILDDQALGGAVRALDIDPDAMRGTWTARIHADPEDPGLAETTWLVEDFLPERLDVRLTRDETTVAPEDGMIVTADVHHLYGAPAAGLEVSGFLDVSPERSLSGYPGYRFGLAEEDIKPERTFLDIAYTGDDGRVVLQPSLPETTGMTTPAVVTFTATVNDSGGRPVQRSIDAALAETRPRIGIRPLFDGTAEESSSVAFNVIGVAPDGAPDITGTAEWTLSSIRRDFQWFRRDGRWDYRVLDRTERVASGTVDLTGESPVRIEAAVDWGAYELAVSADREVLPASVRFDAGWRSEGASLDTPEALQVTLDATGYDIGDTVTAHITAPFAGRAEILVADSRIIDRITVDVPEDGASVEIPVTAAWGTGAYVLATVFRPMDLAARRMPARAMGLAWAAIDPADRDLDIAIDVPDTQRPRTDMPVTLSLGNLPAGETAYVTLAAVDAGILNLTGFEPPAPDDWYFGQRRLGLEIRDVYNQLIDRTLGTTARVRSGGDAGPMRLDGPPPPETLMAFHSGLIEVAADGTAEVTVPIPDFNGTIRLMAIAWSAAGVGHASSDVIVRDPVVVTASLPRFLAPGDVSRLRLDLDNVEGLTGTARLDIATGSDNVWISGGAPGELDLGATTRTAFDIGIGAVRTGLATIDISLDLPDGTVIEKRVPINVRNNEPPMALTSRFELEPGADLTLDTALSAGFRPDTWSATLTASAAPLDVAGIVRALDRYPYGCSEQITSRALPLLYVDEVAAAVGLGADDEARGRVAQAIDRLVARQDSSGSFGLWGAGGGGDLWLDAYITDFMVRADAAGHDVPATALTLALDNLKNSLSYTQSELRNGGVDVAYALLVLAQGGKAAIGDLRYYGNARLDDFKTPLAKAQIGAALMLYGETEDAELAFSAAIAAPPSGGLPGYRFDYGSAVRDSAAVLTLAAEVGSQTASSPELVNRVSNAWTSGRRLSTQDQAWSLLAAHALTTGAARPRYTMDGVTGEGAFAADLGFGDLADGVTFANEGSSPIHVVVTRRGISEVPEPAGGNIGALTRDYYDAETGRAVDPSSVRQGQRLVAVLSVLFDVEEGGRYILDDPLPAGFEIDNPNILRSGDVSVPGLDLSTSTQNTEFRDDRFVVAFDRRDGDSPRRQFAYVVRVVSPGAFAHPAAVVEDMYRPERRARTDSGVVQVAGAKE